MNALKNLILTIFFFPITETDMEQFLGMSLIISAYKPENECLRDFLIRIHKIPQAWDLETYQMMSREIIGSTRPKLPVTKNCEFSFLPIKCLKNLS